MGKLNILHHKSWHVYNIDNQERVRKDEEQARIEAEKKQAKILEAEQEARLSLLRKKKGIAGEVQPAEEEKTSEHIHLFGDLEKLKKTNPEVELEKAKEKEKQHNKSTAYIAGVGGKTDKLPWYADSMNKNDKFKSTHTHSNRPRKNEGLDEKMKELEDPMKLVNKVHREKKQKKERKEEKHKPSLASTSSKTKSIDDLRRERLERETHERRREQILLNPSLAHQLSETDKRHKQEGRFYNSQFNREYVRKDRQPKPQSKYKPY